MRGGLRFGAPWNPCNQNVWPYSPLAHVITRLVAIKYVLNNLRHAFVVVQPTFLRQINSLRAKKEDATPGWVKKFPRRTFCPMRAGAQVPTCAGARQRTGNRVSLVFVHQIGLQPSQNVREKLLKI